jgi:hypothetical protein
VRPERATVGLEHTSERRQYPFGQVGERSCGIV